MRLYLRIPLYLFSLCPSFLCAQSLSMVSGTGQMVMEQFLSNAPMVVLAKDASGKPAAGVAVTWAITQGSGTITLPMTSTDSNGLASAVFLATSLPPGMSFQAATVTATSPSGTVSFIMTTVLTRLPNGGLAAPPLVELISPPLDNRNLSGRTGSTLPAAVVVKVIAQSGFQSGTPVPNVGMRILLSQDATSTPPASCNAPAGIVLTDATGTVTCDLVITGSPGNSELTALVGEVQFTPNFALQISPGVTCTYTLSGASQSIAASGGSGTVNVLTTAGCQWTAAPNAAWINITSGASGSGNGSVSFTSAPNAGAARTGTLTIAGQTFTINQAAGAPGALTITTTGGTLPAGTTKVAYSTTISATGGQPPYTWSATGSLPPGLAFNSAGTLSGTPTTIGSYTFTATVMDTAGSRASQNFSVTINSSGPSTLAIANASFPAGSAGQPYQQLLSTSGGCVTPFSQHPTFAVTGGTLPNGLSIGTNADGSRSISGTPLSAGAFNFTLTATDTCGNTAAASFTITISGTPASTQMLASVASLSFTVQLGGANVPADQTVSITSSGSVLNYSAAIATSTGGNWLAGRSTLSGATPGNITVGAANYSTLAPGTYNGTITITSPASNSPVVLQVNLTVIASPAVMVSPNTFALNKTASGNSGISQQVIAVTSNAGSVHFTASSAVFTAAGWLSVSPSQGDTPGTVTVTINSAGLPPGAYTGSVVITPALGTAQTVSITLNVLAPATLAASAGPLSFSYQQGGTLPFSQTTLLSASGGPLNVTIAAITQSGGSWLSVTPVAASTPVNITASVNAAGLSPGTYSGSIIISATDVSVAPLTIGVTLVIAGAVPSITSITNAASFAPGPVAPGEIVTIFGAAMGPTPLVKLHTTTAGFLDTSLAGTQVFFDNIAAPLVYTSDTQVSAIVPYGVAANGSTRVQVQYQGVRSNVFTVRVIDSSPGIFVLDPSGQGAILNQDTSVNSTANGADPGSIVSIFATGEGQTDPPGIDGIITGTILPRPRLNVTVQIAGQPTEVLYAGAAPGEPAGVLQVNARIPTTAPHGTTVPVVVTVGAAPSQSGVTLSVK